MVDLDQNVRPAPNADPKNVIGQRKQSEENDVISLDIFTFPFFEIFLNDSLDSLLFRQLHTLISIHSQKYNWGQQQAHKNET